MKSDQEVSRHTLDKLIDDASYLLDEAEAMKYVIDAVPYNETPPGGMSIINKLELVDHAQKEYYRPIVQKVFAENRLQRLNEFEHYKETFEEADDSEKPDIQKTLSDIIKHRASLINTFERIPLYDWGRILKDESGNELMLIDFANQMVKGERAILKEIADLVLVYQNELQHQREISRKSSQRKSSE